MVRQNVNNMANPVKRGGQLVIDDYRATEKGKAFKSQSRKTALAKTGSSKVANSPINSVYARSIDAGNEQSQTGTSIFDPVLCELIYRWFCPKGGRILDPFAGGSVRGIVAGYLGYDYTGVELRAEQVEANCLQGDAILVGNKNKTIPIIGEGLTPIESAGDFFVKRDDYFSIAGVRGGKVRTCWFLSQGAGGLVTAGSRQSPQANIVAHIAEFLDIPCHIHTPMGELSSELKDAKRCGAEVIQHKAGYNNVIISRARDDAKKLGWVNIPFGMECEEAINQTRQQVQSIPNDVKRIVVPIGSGMSLAGILWGLKDSGVSIPVLGVKVGANPVKRLDKYAPSNWRDMVELIDCGIDYHTEARGEVITDNGNIIQLDPIYEAKCRPYIKAGDLFWIVGIRKTITTIKGEQRSARWVVGDSINIDTLASGEYDLIFSCPPYYDLELYSDLEGELSAVPSYDDFIKAYREIVSKSVVMLRDNSFACFVVGDIRDKKGFYRNFVSDTISAFQDAGMLLYNEAILVTAVGSLPIRVTRAFQSNRKLGKTHQNVLIFYKGDPKQIKLLGDVEVGEVQEADNDSAMPTL